MKEQSESLSSTSLLGLNEFTSLPRILPFAEGMISTPSVNRRRKKHPAASSAFLAFGRTFFRSLVWRPWIRGRRSLGHVVTLEIQLKDPASTPSDVDYLRYIP